MCAMFVFLVCLLSLYEAQIIYIFFCAFSVLCVSHVCTFLCNLFVCVSVLCVCGSGFLFLFSLLRVVSGWDGALRRQRGRHGRRQLHEANGTCRACHFWAEKVCGRNQNANKPRQDKTKTKSKTRKPALLWLRFIALVYSHWRGNPHCCCTGIFSLAFGV